MHLQITRDVWKNLVIVNMEHANKNGHPPDVTVILVTMAVDAVLFFGRMRDTMDIDHFCLFPSFLLQM